MRVRPQDCVLVAQELLGKHVVRTGPLCGPIPVLGDSGILGTISDSHYKGYTSVRAVRRSWYWRQVAGLIEIRRNPKRAIITYSTHLNVCYSRFVICKEVINALISDDDNITQDVVSLVAALITQAPAIDDDCVGVDRLAVIGAVELLMPAQFDGELYAMADGGKTHREIAENFRAPEFVVSWRLSPTGRPWFDRLHND